jgi:hypothetical protein
MDPSKVPKELSTTLKHFDPENLPDTRTRERKTPKKFGDDEHNALPVSDNLGQQAVVETVPGATSDRKTPQSLKETNSEYSKTMPPPQQNRRVKGKRITRPFRKSKRKITCRSVVLDGTANTNS